MKVLRGNLHIHSDQSDGTLPVPEIAGIAQRCGLDFIGINDHYAVRQDHQYIGGVLVLMGTELNRRHSHYLAYNAPVQLPPDQQDGAVVVKAVRDCGGVGIIAHPFEKGSPVISRGRHYPWKNWAVRGFDGIEVWNLTSQWRDAVAGYVRALLMWLCNKYMPFYSGPCPEALAKWDELCQTGHVTGVAGSDLHAPQRRVLGITFRILDYPLLMSAVNNYVLVQELQGDARADACAVLGAFKRGRCWFAFDKLAPAREFSFVALGREEGTLGDVVQRRGSRVRLKVASPLPGRISVLRNGLPALAKEGQRLEANVAEPGVYRVEIKLRRRGRWLPWLYSNPLYVK